MRIPLIISVIALSTVSFAGDAKQTEGTPTPGKEAGQPTSNRTPGKETPTPLPQTTKQDGETSDRTPSNDRSGAKPE